MHNRHKVLLQWDPMRVLLHACCAPCLSAPHEFLTQEEGHEVVALWYNPNIHPYTEYLRRLHEVQRYSALRPVEVVYIDEYPLEVWLRMILDWTATGKFRCEACYRDRLERCAEYASENGFDAFTTTLLLSRHQPHELVRKVASEASKKYDIPFLYRDFRRLWKRSIAISRELHLYRQPYCGCIFSEYERFGEK